MTNRQKRRSKATAAETMAFVSPPNLRAAMAQAEIGVSELARRIGDRNKQTVHNLTRGDAPKRTHRSRLRRLADVLSVPAQFLAGGHLSLPLSGEFHFRVALEQSPRFALAMGKLLHDVDRACRRDLRPYSTIPSSDEAMNAFELVRHFMQWAIGGLIDPSEWQQALLVKPPTRPPKAPRQENEPERPGFFMEIRPMLPEEEDAAMALVEAFSRLLQPWFRGESRLFYRKLEAILASFCRGARFGLRMYELPRKVLLDGRSVPLTHPESPFTVLFPPSHRAGSDT